MISPNKAVKASETIAKEEPPSTGAVVPKEELLELVRAIKFAKPEASQKQVHQEITQELSHKHDAQFAFLKDVALNDVKKVWKKAIQPQGFGATASETINADLRDKLKLQDQPPQVFTIGNNNSVQFLAQTYTAANLAQQAVQQVAQEQAEQASLEALARDYVHIFLDVPADKSGSRPHQALINFQSKSSSKGSETKSSGSNKKKQNKKKSTSAAVATAVDSEGREIVKIQRAAPTEGDETTQHPMLLYNQSRSQRTFLHPDETDEHRGYERIQEWMVEAGKTGVLGAAGGTKAYFWARLTPGQTKQGQPGILSIDMTQLAPAQGW